MKEQRKHKRRHLVFYLRVFDASTDTLLGYLGDITPGGLMLVSETPVPTGRAYSLRMSMPTQFGENDVLEFEARCLRCRRAQNPDLYEAGFVLVREDPEVLAAVQRLVDDLGFNDSE